MEIMWDIPFYPWTEPNPDIYHVQPCYKPWAKIPIYHKPWPGVRMSILALRWKQKKRRKEIPKQKSKRKQKKKKKRRERIVLDGNLERHRCEDASVCCGNRGNGRSWEWFSFPTRILLYASSPPLALSVSTSSSTTTPSKFKQLSSLSILSSFLILILIQTLFCCYSVFIHVPT